MSLVTKKLPPVAGGDRYWELLSVFPLRPIHSKGAYKNAMEMVDGLAVREEGKLTVDERDYLDTLTLLIEKYEQEHQRLDLSSVDPVTLLKHLMEEHGMNTTALGKLLGSKGIASEVLNGKRSISKAHMVTLAEHFNVDPSVFLPSRK